MTDGELLEILDKTFHVDSNGFVHYQSAKAWIHYGRLVAEAEREACAKVCLEGTDMPVQKDTLKIIKAERKRILKAILARGKE